MGCVPRPEDYEKYARLASAISDDSKILFAWELGAYCKELRVDNSSYNTPKAGHYR